MNTPKYNLLPTLTPIIEAANNAFRLYPIPSISELLKEYKKFYREFISFEQNWIKRDEEMKHGLSIAHKAIVSTYKSIQTMEFKSFNQIYSPQCIEREEKNQLYFQFKQAVRDMSNNTLDSYRLDSLKKYLERYSSLNFKLFDCKNISVYYINCCFIINTYLSKLLSEKENLLKKYPQLKNIQEDLSRTEVYEYWSNRNTDLAYVRDFVLNAIEELHSVFINGQINKEFNNALEEIAELRFSRESHYFNLIISK